MARRWRGIAAAVVVLAIAALMLRDAMAGDREPGGEAAPRPSSSSSAAPVPPPAEQQVVPGARLRPLPLPAISPAVPDLPDLPDLPELAPASTGRVGTGLTLGPLTSVDAPVGGPVEGTVTTAVANLPNRTGAAAFAGSLRTLGAADPDFVMLNEVSSRSTDELRSLMPGYGAYRDEQRDRTAGGETQSLMNVVLWRASDWTLVDAGRVKLVDDDRGFRQGKAYVWDRYATWATLQRADGDVVSVVSTHQMTNPARYPQQHGRNPMSRAQQYGVAMDVLVETVRVLAAHGPVLVGGDMNTHGREGPWTAVSRLGAAGYGYAKDSAVMYVFYPSGASVVDHREVRVSSDHPAIVTTLDLAGVGPSFSPDHRNQVRHPVIDPVRT